MTIFGNLTTDGLEETQDRLGGFSVKESGAYTGTIKAAYAGVASSSKAQSVTVILTLEDSSEYRETFWITNRNGENFFKNQNDKKVPLPGFTIVDDLCLVTSEKPLCEQATEEKVMNIWDHEQRKELPTSVPMLTELLGKKVTFGIIKQTVNKNEKDSSGNYVPTAETREENVTDKVFHHPTGLTVNEAKNGLQEAVFLKAWIEKNQGQTRDRRKVKDGAPNGVRNGRPGMPPQAGQTPARTSSLFGAR